MLGSTQWGPLDRAGGTTLVQMGRPLALSLTPGLMWGVGGIVMSQFDGTSGSPFWTTRKKNVSVAAKDSFPTRSKTSSNFLSEASEFSKVT